MPSVSFCNTAPLPVANNHSPFERSAAERRDSALGLARFKIASGDVERARAIALQFGLSNAEIGLADEESLSDAA